MPATVSPSLAVAGVAACPVGVAVRVTWSRPRAPVSYYVVQRYLGGWQTLGTTTAVAFTDPAPPSAEVLYRVQAVANGVGSGPWSAGVSLRCGPSGLLPPPATVAPVVVPVTVADKNFLFAQEVASTTWIIVHNLGKYPAVETFDSTGRSWEGAITFDSLDQVTVRFSVPFAGYGSCN